MIDSFIFKIVKFYELLKHSNKRTFFDTSSKNVIQTAVNKLAFHRGPSVVPQANFILCFVIGEDKYFSDEKKKAGFKDEDILHRIDQALLKLRLFHLKDIDDAAFKVIENLITNGNKEEYYSLVSSSDPRYKMYKNIYDHFHFYQTDSRTSIAEKLRQKDVASLVLSCGKQILDLMTPEEFGRALRAITPESLTPFVLNLRTIVENCTTLSQLQILFYKFGQDRLILNVCKSHFFDKRLCRLATIKSWDNVPDINKDSEIGYIFNDLIENVIAIDINSELTFDKIMWNVFCITLFNYEIEIPTCLEWKKILKQIQDDCILLNTCLLHLVYEHTEIETDLFERMRIECLASEPGSPKEFIYKELIVIMNTHTKKYKK